MEWEAITQNSKSGGKLSWAHEVDRQTIVLGEQNDLKACIWGNFDISKISNAGFKLEYVNPETEGAQLIGEIDFEI